MEKGFREFWFVRHGESESNAGMPSDSDETTPLTQRGVEQSKYIPQHISIPPNLFVISPYYRAAQTAEPTLRKFTNSPSEIWPIQEYTYLPHDLYRGTTSKQRARPSINYFLRADPDVVLGAGAESFNQFMGRVDNTLQQLNERKEKFIVLFGHGWFFRAMLWQLYLSNDTTEEKQFFIELIAELMPNSAFFLGLTHRLNVLLASKKMLHFLLFSSAVKTPNCSIIKLSLNSEFDAFRLTGFSLDHLPSNLRKTTLVNR